MNYIDQNPVVAGLAATPEEWKASGAFYKKRGISGLADLTPADNPPEIKLLPPIPYAVSKLIPPGQLAHILYYIGAYAVALDKLNDLLPQIPKIGGTKEIQNPQTYLHYYTPTHAYSIYEYDGENTMYGKAQSLVYPAETAQQKLNLAELKKNRLLKLEIRA
jgi:hypothetical protein